MKKVLPSILAIALILMTFVACEVDEPDSTDFSGTWNCAEQSSLYGTLSYQTSIRHDSLLDGLIYISNFYNLGTAVEAEVDLFGFEAEIPLQTLVGKTISGSGDLLNANKITLNYIVNDGIDSDTVSSTLTRVQ